MVSGDYFWIWSKKVIRLDIILLKVVKSQSRES